MSTPMSFKRRAAGLLIVFAVVLTALIGRLAYLQLVRGPELESWAMAQWMRDVPVEPKRGIIYDRNLRELAISANADTVVAIPARIQNPQQTTAKLAAVLGISEQSIYDRITQRRSLVYVARKVTPEQAAEIRALDLEGVTFQIETKRYYPHQNLASHVLGFAGIDNQGLNGVELTYDKILSGTAGEVRYPTDARSGPLTNANPEYVPPVDGNSIVLTIDEVIQHIAERELDVIMKLHNAQSAMAVAMSPKTGEILAMANRPDFDPNYFNLYPQELWRNAVVSDSFEPGSTFKVVTAAAGLNEGVVKESDRFFDPGYIIVAGARLHCHKAGGHGDQTFEQVIWNSCNPGFVSVAQKLGKDSLFRYIDAFGFGKKSGIDLPGEATGIMFQKVGPVELATTSFGQGPSVTPLQQVVAMGAVANGGNLFQPRLVKEVHDPEGNLIETYEPTVLGNPITEETAARLRVLLEGVVVNGSGKHAYIEGYRVAGKTGTAQVPKPGGGYYSDRYIASFIGFAPANDPEIVMLVMINDPKGNYGYYGSMVAAPAYKAMMADILRYLDIKPSTEAPGLQPPGSILVPELRGLSTTAALAHLRDLGLNLRMEQVGTIVLEQTPKPGAEVMAGTTIVVELGENPLTGGKVEVPDIRGLPMRDAMLRLYSLGLKIVIEGTGIAVSQSPEPGIHVDVGSAIKVVFRP